VDKKLRAKKFIKKTLVSIFVLLFLFIGTGVAYTWYMGRNVDTSLLTEPVEYKPTPVIKRVEQSENVPESVAIQSLTSPVLPGSNASITIRTNQKSLCNISVIYNEIASKDSGLVDKPSDEYGMVSWSWTVESSVPIGKWPVKVTCTRDEKSAVVVGNLNVVNQIEP